jgi:hypothetical protein
MQRKIDFASHPTRLPSLLLLSLRGRLTLPLIRELKTANAATLSGALKAPTLRLRFLKTLH